MGTNYYWQPRVTTLREAKLEYLGTNPNTLILLFPNGLAYLDATSTPLFDHENPTIHLGKRSLAGKYCWVCKVSFCKAGAQKVHFQSSEWYDRCPKCKSDAADRVTVCNSFTWAQNDVSVTDICFKSSESDLIILDEYQNGYTGKQFLAILDRCPIQNFYHMGTRFY